MEATLALSSAAGCGVIGSIAVFGVFVTSADGSGAACEVGAGLFSLLGNDEADDASFALSKLVRGPSLAGEPRIVFAGEFAFGAGVPCLLVNACDDGGVTAFLIGNDGAPTTLVTPWDDGVGTGDDDVTLFSGMDEDSRIVGDVFEDDTRLVVMRLLKRLPVFVYLVFLVYFVYFYYLV